MVNNAHNALQASIQDTAMYSVLAQVAAIYYAMSLPSVPVECILLTTGQILNSQRCL